MFFLRLLFRSFIKSPAKVSGAQKKQPLPLARFLRQSSHFSSEKKIVKQAAFVPPADLRLSIFRINGLVRQHVRQLGATHLGKSPQGWAKFTETDVVKAGLSLDRNETPERHFDIIGWPAEKDQRKLMALELAQASRLIL